MIDSIERSVITTLDGLETIISQDFDLLVSVDVMVVVSGCCTAYVSNKETCGAEPMV